ncbi:hypothetical protein SAMN05444161_2619 [Rhizobiales bacterium GAS191]|nr:hypothetical protein SAMN05444161_2619 [Rhizobiales bacterium GAS191]
MGELLVRVADLGGTVSEQREEIARLKGLKGRPDIKPGKPSGMEKASHPKPWNPPRRGGGNKTAKRIVHEERIVTASAPPGLSRPGLRWHRLATYASEARPCRFAMRIISGFAASVLNRCSQTTSECQRPTGLHRQISSTPGARR